MSTVEERLAYLDNPFFDEKKRIYGDFTTFYWVIAACTVFGLFLFILNLICGCCSKHSSYWNERHTGNRWLVTIFTSTAHKQPPLDLSELENVKIDYPKHFPGEVEQVHQVYEYDRKTQKSRRPFGSPFHQYQSNPSIEYSAVQVAPQPQQLQEFVELQKRESAI